MNLCNEWLHKLKEKRNAFLSLFVLELGDREKEAFRERSEKKVFYHLFLQPRSFKFLIR
jgi:hypothetical protein